MYTPIILTQQNYQWAIAENYRLILEEIAFKIPVNGIVQLQGNLDFNGNTVRGVSVLGPRSAICEQPYS